MTQSNRAENPIELKIRQATRNVLEQGIGGGASDSDMNLAAFGWLATKLGNPGNPGHNGSRRERILKKAGGPAVGGGAGILILEIIRAVLS